MLTNSRVSQYSPNSEESDEQPLDFSKNSISASAITSIIKRESNGRDRHSTSSPRQSPHHPPANCFTTPSPSPPEHNPNSHHTNQVLCQLLTGNLIPTSTGKLIAATAGKNGNSLSVQNDSQSNHFKGLTSQSPGALSASSPPNASLMQALNERHNSSVSPTGSASPIGLGPLNQVEMHFAQSPNASGVDRFGTSGGLLTTAPTSGGFGANDSAKRALKYSRPFKAYPRDPLSIPMSYYGVGLQMPLTADAIATQSLLATASDQAYLQFREQMLVSRKNTQEPRRNGQPSGPLSMPKHSPPIPDMHDIHNSNSNSNGNNSSNTHINSNISNNGNNIQQNIYSNRSVSPSSHSLAVKMNGSMAAMTPISSASQINSDETLDYSNGNSSGNSSSGEADVGSLNSSGGAHSGRHSDGQSMRKRGRPLPDDLKDEAYWERRRKNNEAAKRSRDARRAKEDEIAIRAAFLEQENLKLRCEIAQLKTETTKLRCLLYNS